MSLVIHYESPANAAPNPNDPQAGDAAGDSGRSYVLIDRRLIVPVPLWCL